MTDSKRVLFAIFFSLPMLILAVFNFIPPIAQNLHYHQFADQRLIFGIPNFWNVFSNSIFIVFGIYGFWKWQKLFSQKNTPTGLMLVYLLSFFGIFLTGLGSAYYHWQPDNERLVWDRLPMTLVFMPLLAVSISEKINIKAGLYSVIPLCFLGIFSVLYWFYTETLGKGDLRLYGIVQFYPLLAIPLIVLLFPKKTGFTKAFMWVAFFYLLAKITEYADLFFLEWTFISGHSLKHLLAGVASFYIVKAFVEARKI